MLGQEHEVILKATTVARIHNAIYLEQREEIRHEFVKKMSDALDALQVAVMDYEEFKAEQDRQKN